jgi:hypothetical protein
MSNNMDFWFPCGSFFASGRVGAGLIALAMQLTLLLWPLAAKWARGQSDQSHIERMLTELSETHRPPVDPYSRPLKTFRKAA